jgi:hypothetical protein
MKQSLQSDTLAFQLGCRPALQLRNMSAISLPKVVDSLKVFMDLTNPYEWIGSSKKENLCVAPESDGIIFYMLNHAVSVIRSRVHPLQPLGKYLPIMDLYHEQLSLRSARMFYYLLMICTKEARHEKKGSGMHALYAKYGSLISEFHQENLGEAAAINKLKSNPPNVEVGHYCAFLAEQFYKGNYHSGFGGPKWGQIGDVLRDFVQGKITAEMMMDTGFTLCHNGGPIFNKGMLYEHWTAEINKILDVQRSGQIPQLVASSSVSQAKEPAIKGMWKQCREAIGDEFDGHVDWYLVEELGSKQQYPTEKAAQTNKYGVPAKAKAKLEALKAKAEVAAKEAEEAKGLQVEIFPGQYIYKLKRKQMVAA